MRYSVKEERINNKKRIGAIQKTVGDLFFFSHPGKQ